MGHNFHSGGYLNDWVFIRSDLKSLLKMARIKKIIVSSIFVSAGLAIAVVVSFRATKEAGRNNKIEEEVAVLQREAEKIRKDNQNLEERIAYFETQEFQEREAKEKLNFQKEGEKVVVVRPSPFQETGQEASVKGVESSRVEMEIPNYNKWWNHFFKY